MFSYMDSALFEQFARPRGAKQVIVYSGGMPALLRVLSLVVAYSSLSPTFFLHGLVVATRLTGLPPLETELRWSGCARQPRGALVGNNIYSDGSTAN